MQMSYSDQTHFKTIHNSNSSNNNNRDNHSNSTDRNVRRNTCTGEALTTHKLAVHQSTLQLTKTGTNSRNISSNKMAFYHNSARKTITYSIR